MPTPTAALGWAGACALLMLPAAVLAKRPPPPPMVDTTTSRMVIERQLAPQPAVPSRLSGAEAKRVHDLYLLSIGRILETNHDSDARGGK